MTGQVGFQKLCGLTGHYGIILYIYIGKPDLLEQSKLEFLLENQVIG